MDMLDGGLKTHDSEARGQEETTTTEWVFYKEHLYKIRKRSSHSTVTASTKLSQA